MAKPLRVALLARQMSPAAGGLAVSVPGLARNLDALKDFEVHVLGTLDPANQAAAQKWGPRVHAFPVSGPALLQRAPRMAHALSELDPDIVDVQGLWSWASKINLDHHRRVRKPYIVTPRGMLDPWALRNSAWNKRLFSFFAETAHLRNAHCLRATAEMEADHFRKAGMRNPIAIVPNAIVFPELMEKKDRGIRSILFLSRIHPKKGIVHLLKGWTVLQDQFPDWEVVIAGIDDRGHEAELRKFVSNGGLERVRFVGPVHGSEKQQLYRDADLFVLPTYAENFGLVIAEALAQGTPVITTHNAPWSGLEDYRCGWWIEHTQTALNTTLQSALRMPETELREMGIRGRNWVRSEFGWGEVTEKMRELYLWTARGAQKPDFVYL